jgi:hypothetical protein
MFEHGTPVRETPLHGRRFIGIGYARRAAGLTRQLVVIEYNWSANFHREIHFPNHICALFVRADNPTEIRSVEGAFDALSKGDNTALLENHAYAWAWKYELPTKEDCFEAKRQPDGTLVAAEAAWSLRLTSDGQGAAFVARDWESKDGEEMAFVARRAAVEPRTAAPPTPPSTHDANIEH